LEKCVQNSPRFFLPSNEMNVCMARSSSPSEGCLRPLFANGVTHCWTTGNNDAQSRCGTLSGWCCGRLNQTGVAPFWRYRQKGQFAQKKASLTKELSCIPERVWQARFPVEEFGTTSTLYPQPKLRNPVTDH